ncbi:MAG: hypothetical protein ABIE84_06435 [bacterium]
MAIASISIKVRGSFNLKAVREHDGSMTGVVRMSGSGVKTSKTQTRRGIERERGLSTDVTGICLAFSVPVVGETIQTFPDSLFFMAMKGPWQNYIMAKCRLV